MGDSTVYVRLLHIIPTLSFTHIGIYNINKLQVQLAYTGKLTNPPRLTYTPTLYWPEEFLWWPTKGLW